MPTFLLTRLQSKPDLPQPFYCSSKRQNSELNNQEKGRYTVKQIKQTSIYIINMKKGANSKKDSNNNGRPIEDRSHSEICKINLPTITSRQDYYTL